MTGILDGQVAIVTGGGRGIGRAIGESLARAGAAVALVSRSRHEVESVAAGIVQSGGRAIALAVDVRDQASMRVAVAEVRSQLGPITLLVNNAGTPGPRGADWEVDGVEWWEGIEVAVRGAFVCNQAVIPGMIENGGGRIIHVASTTGTTANPRFTSTSVAKTAVIRLAEGLARSGAEHHVRSFSIHPGIVKTRLLESYGLTIPENLYSPPERAGVLCERLASGVYDALSGTFITVDDDLDEMLTRADLIASGSLQTLRILR